MFAAKFVVYVTVVLVAEVYLVHAQDRIKMCGRDLIRLAVSSCGNSRLRRSILDIEHGNQDAFSEKDQTSEKLRVPLQFNERKDFFSLAPHWYPLSSRIRRASGKISDICCEKGCSMKELIQFC
ncbi:unnamed protein product [Menidia menidia]|uniref:Insulin-like 3 n=1 Tax=Menidia menidia TaxID=238744 RepID=A0A8S4AW18_9TELE|nr:unnamed protein product [Menidia menidia]